MPHAKVDNQSHATERFWDQKVRRLYLQRLASEKNLEGTLIEKLCRHQHLERVSFHMPGHKGRLHLPGGAPIAVFADLLDVTELDGLDDLTYPQGVLKGLEDRISRLYKVGNTILSVSGASGGLMAAVMAVAKRGQELLVPRNAHRSVVHALVLSGLRPRWYEPYWSNEWGLWQSADIEEIDRALKASQSPAGVLVVSPTFPGDISDIESIAKLVHEHNLPLIVDEAQGTHFLPNSNMPVSAGRLGADIVVHSFHKTLGALTQTGAVHVVNNRFVNAEDVRAALRAVSTSSPSYVLMASIEEAVLIHEIQEGIDHLNGLTRSAEKLKKILSEKFHVYQTRFQNDPLHILIGSTSLNGTQLNQLLLERGMYCEAVLGTGCLLLLGSGTSDEDIETVVQTIADFPALQAEANLGFVQKPKPVDQVINPREAYFAESEVVSLDKAIGRISADCFAPCPPGMAVCVPGARVSEEDLNGVETKGGSLRVLLSKG